MNNNLTKNDGSRMIVLRLLPLLIAASFLAGCAATAPLLLAQGNDLTNNAHTASTGTQVKPEGTSPKRKQATPKPKPAPISAAAEKEFPYPTTPNVGSPEWEKKEKAENERKEQHIKQVIEGICRNCYILSRSARSTNEPGICPLSGPYVIVIHQKCSSLNISPRRGALHSQAHEFLDASCEDGLKCPLRLGCRQGLIRLIGPNNICGWGWRIVATPRMCATIHASGL